MRMFTYRKGGSDWSHVSLLYATGGSQEPSGRPVFAAGMHLDHQTLTSCCFSQAMGISSLRYPGGEEANSYEWAPPPYLAQTKPQPVLTTGSGFPGGDWLFYDQFHGTFQSSVMSFDHLMDICAALNISDPYLVLNHDSVNIGGPRASTDWGYVQLKQAAIAWAQYIVQQNYTVRPAYPDLL